MRNLRYFLRLITAFIIRFKGIIFIGAVLGVIFFLVSRTVAPYFVNRSTQIIGVTGRYHTEELPLFILKLIGDGLTKIAEDQVVVPSLASSWETPDKGKTWIFHLEKDLKWHDGSPVKSRDIAYEFSDVEVETPDDKTIIFKLKEQFSPFPSIVSHPTFSKGLLGTGKWQVDKIALAGSFVQKLVLINISELGPNKPKQTKKKIVKFYPTENQTKLAFKLGEIDTIEATFDPVPFDTWDTVEVIGENKSNQIVTIFFNTKDKYLGEKSLRQALVYALDKKAFDGPRAIGPIQSTSWAFNPQVKKYEFNKDRAKEFINDLPEELAKDLEINLVSTPMLLSVAESIADKWQEVGIKTRVQVSSVIPSDSQAFLAIFDAPSDPDQYSMWHSTQESTNISKYSDPRIDKLLEDGRLELDLDERRKIYLDFQRFLVEDSPAAFLYYPTVYRIERK